MLIEIIPGSAAALGRREAHPAKTMVRDATKIPARMRAYESKVLYMHGTYSMGTPVLPSDVALQFEDGRPLGGSRAKEFRWVPTINGSGNELRYLVVASTRSRFARPEVKRFVEVVQDEARTIMSDHKRSDLLL
jgi:hypothetical protein